MTSTGQDYVAVWAISFLDLMGYRQDLLLTGDKPAVDEDEIHRRFSGVVERRKLLAKPLEAYFNRPRSDLYSAAVTPGGPPISQFMGAGDVRVTGFSDSVFLESSLGASHNPLVPLHTVVAASIVALFMNLKSGSPVRGGIDIGYGPRSDGHVYSAATVRAVELEKCAKYPRILVGPSLIGTLDLIASSGETDEARMARTIRGLFYADPDDGRIGIDFMGEVSKKFYAPGFTPGDVRDIWRFAQGSRASFGVRGVEKVWGYYDRLLKYMEPRLALWDVDKSS